MICIVTQGLLSDFNVIEQIAPNQFVHIGREKISDPKAFQFDNTYYVVFRVKIRTQNPRPSLGLEWQERVRVSFTESRLQNQNQRVTFDNYHDKGLVIVGSSTRLEDHEKNRAILYCHHYFTDRSSGRREKGMFHEHHHVRAERGDTSI